MRLLESHDLNLFKFKREISIRKMCGIFSLLVPERRCPSKDIVTENFNKLQHRGPDNSELVIKRKSHRIESFVHHFGFHRLAINGLDSKSNQPFQINDCILICNGEIYNHRELALQYNITLESNSDCEIIIHLYKLVGPACANLLDGVFSFILYDNKANKLVVARDPIGVRPLFYQIQGDSLAFASEAKALIGLNDVILGQSAPFLTMGTVDIIKQFPQGSYLVTDFNKVHKPVNTTISSYLHEHFYDAPFKYDSSCRDLIIKNIRTKLTSAISKRLMSDRPIGCLLSGGVDSSIIAACLAKEYQAQGKNIKTFSVGFDDSTDLKFAKIVADHIGSEHHEIRLNYADAIERIPDVIRDIETNDITSIRAATGMYMASEYISKNFDEIVIFSGEGADELFAGYLYFHYAPSPQDLADESMRLIKNLPYYDVLRADRSTASHGLELRVPFLDKSFVQFCMAIDGAMKSPQRGIEKYYLRKAFEDLLPQEIIWRRKEGFSDGVGGLQKPWYRWIQDHIAKEYPDDHVIQGANTVITVGDVLSEYPSREAWYYDYIFLQYYSNLVKPVPAYWMPKWQETDDPSGRMMNVFDK